MPTKIAIFVCDDMQGAETAKQFLLGQHYPPEAISVEPTSEIMYNAQKYDGGTAETKYGKFVVIGRKTT